MQASGTFSLVLALLLTGAATFGVAIHYIPRFQNAWTVGVGGYALTVGLFAIWVLRTLDQWADVEITALAIINYVVLGEWIYFAARAARPNKRRISIAIVSIVVLILGAIVVPMAMLLPIIWGG